MFLFRPQGGCVSEGKKKIHYTVQGWDIYDPKYRQTEGQVQALKTYFLCCTGSVNKGQLCLVIQSCNELRNMALCLLFTKAVQEQRRPLSYKEAHLMLAVLFCPLLGTVVLLNVREVKKQIWKQPMRICTCFICGGRAWYLRVEGAAFQGFPGRWCKCFPRGSGLCLKITHNIKRLRYFTQRHAETDTKI